MTFQFEEHSSWGFREFPKFELIQNEGTVLGNWTNMIQISRNNTLYGPILSFLLYFSDKRLLKPTELKSDMLIKYQTMLKADKVCLPLVIDF